MTSALMCIGHRGARGHAPENTLPSFERAIALGCDWVELDVYALDSHLVVIHDEKVDRTTNGKGLLADFSFDALRELDAGDGAVIPTLNEVLDLIDQRCGVNIELKGTDTAAPVSRMLRDYCAHGWQPTQFLLSSFSHQELALADPAFRRGALFNRRHEDLWQQAAAVRAWSVNFALKDVDRPLVEEAHRLGYRVLVYTVNKPGDIRRMIALGVDGLFSDYPDRVLEALAP